MCWQLVGFNRPDPASLTASRPPHNANSAYLSPLDCRSPGTGAGLMHNTPRRSSERRP